MFFLEDGEPNTIFEAFYIDSKGINGARFAYMTKYIVTPVRNNFDKWPNL